MTSIVSNSGETQTSNVLHVDVVHASVKTTIISAHRTAIPGRVAASGKPDFHVGVR